MNIELKEVTVHANKDKRLLDNISVSFQSGQFVAVLGENGAGKTSLLDLLMGFKKASSGSVLVAGEVPSNDSWMLRSNMTYLSEKVDVPGDWTAREFLDFHHYFYEKYSDALEAELISEFRVKPSARIGGMSAGEIRRVQIVAGLASSPKLIIIDEITAVLDIVGRRLLMKRLARSHREMSATVILATNILEDLHNYITHLLVMNSGRVQSLETLEGVLGGRPIQEFSQVIADRLEVA